MVAIAIGTGVGIAAAYTTHEIWGTQIGVWGGRNWAFFDTDGNMNENDDEVIFYLNPTYGGLVTDLYGQARAEIVVERTGTTPSTYQASARIKGSGGGEVRADESGDVIITLGS